MKCPHCTIHFQDNWHVERFVHYNPIAEWLYTAAETATGRAAERILHCRGCQIGATHAGVNATYFSRMYDSNLCPRCHKTWLRMIGQRVCVSCYNRERELRLGRNAKGIFPAGVRPLYRLSITAIVNDAPRIVTDTAHDRLELVLRVMRTTAGKISFAPTPDTSMLSDDAIAALQERSGTDASAISPLDTGHRVNRGRGAILTASRKDTE